MKEDQPVRSGHRAILQRFNIAIGKYGDLIFSLNCLALIIIFIKSSLKRLMVTVISGRWPRIEGTIAPRFRIFFQLFSDTFLNSDMRLQWLWLHLTGNLFDNIMTWGSSWCIFFSSFLDVWILLYCFPGVVLSRAEERDRLIFGPIFRWRCKGMFTSENQKRFMQTIFVDRKSSESRRSAVAEMRRRCVEPRWPRFGLLDNLAEIILHLMILMTRHQGSDFPRGHHNQRHRPHPLQVSFCRFHVMHLFLFDRR